MSYETYRVADLIDEIAMGPFGSNIKVSCFVDSGVPVLNGSNLEGFSLSEKAFRYVTEEKADSLNKANAHRGDIVITHRGTLGQIVFIPQDSRYDRYVISQSQFRVRCNDKVLPEYLVYYFHTPIGQYKLLSNASQVGVPALARPSSTFQQIEVTLPELSIQKRVVEIITTIQRKIENNQELNDNLEQQAATYFQELFINNANPMWQISTISDLGTVVGGSTPSKTKPEYYTNNGIAWITPKDLSINKSKFISHGENDITELGLKNSSATVMPKGTVLFSSRAPIGYIAIASNEVTTNQGFKSVIPYSEIGTAFVYFFLKHSLPVIESAASGSTFKEISGSAMKNIPAIIPDRNTLDQFNSFCAPIFAQQKILEEQNHSLAMLRDSLLPKLMSGAIDIASIQL
ncbi:restriction endonuclease subunit S [Faecalibacterium sp. I3-3-89]|nr:restriction endonuclease subunit S [Faecalibacterium sp. I3-3-89]UQK44166.1 restriction endonuclease subunit S [Faecalibacterium sp. I3-3-89]